MLKKTRLSLILAGFMVLLVIVPGGFAAPDVQAEPVDVSGLEIVETTEIDLVAGPMMTSAYLAPNGEYFARFQRVEGAIAVCIHALDGDITGCAEAPIRNYDSGSVRWSPDSTKLVFAQDFLRMFIDSDIWLVDAETFTARNITDDGTDELDIFGGDDDVELPPVDLLPMWGADSESVYFIRYTLTNAANRNRPELYRLNLDSGTEEVVERFATVAPLAIYRGTISPDGRWFAYGLDVEAGRTVNVRLLDLETGDDRLLTPFSLSEERLYYIDYMAFSADSRYLLTHDPSYMMRMGRADLENPVIRVFDLDGNEFVIDAENPVTDAAWLAEGAGLIYQVVNPDDMTEGALYITGEPGEPGRLLLDERYWGTTSMQEQLLVGANNTLLMTARGGSALVVLALGAE